jgi:hypothetical protein
LPNPIGTTRQNSVHPKSGKQDFGNKLVSATPAHCPSNRTSKNIGHSRRRNPDAKGPHRQQLSRMERRKPLCAESQNSATPEQILNQKKNNRARWLLPKKKCKCQYEVPLPDLSFCESKNQVCAE